MHGPMNVKLINSLLKFVRILIILNSKYTVWEFPILRSEGGRHLLYPLNAELNPTAICWH